MVSVLLVPVGTSLTAATVTVAVIAEADSAPLLSLATAVKALSVPLALVAGVQYALLMVSTVALVLAFQAWALAAFAPIFRVPEATDLITKLVTVPSTSASSPWASRSLKVISTVVSSLVVSTGVAKAVRVGMSLVPVMVMLVF